MQNYILTNYFLSSELLSGKKEPFNLDARILVLK